MVTPNKKIKINKINKKYIFFPKKKNFNIMSDCLEVPKPEKYIYVSASFFYFLYFLMCFMSVHPFFIFCTLFAFSLRLLFIERKWSQFIGSKTLKGQAI
jgi:hypothetical protein